MGHKEDNKKSKQRAILRLSFVQGIFDMPLRCYHRVTKNSSRFRHSYNLLHLVGNHITVIMKH